MPDEQIDNLFRQPVCWLMDNGPEDDIAISSRIRLARNLSGEPFPIRSDDATLGGIRDSVFSALGKVDSMKDSNTSVFRVDELSELDRRFLLERHLISREFLNPRHGSGLVTNREQGAFVMINEEDHLRLQVLAPGFQLNEIWQQINRLDDELSVQLPFAFDKTFGYLTSCPTNIGTGMRASVMLHLPGLVLTNQIQAVVQGVNKLGLAVRGFYGEGSQTLGNLYQISNQSTLGESEDQIIRRLSTVISQIIAHEKKARALLLANRQCYLMNHIGRAYGLLKHSYIITGDESLNCLSALRLGVDLNMFQSVNIHTVNELFLLVQAAHLQKYEGHELNQENRDVVRAALLRKFLQE